MLHLHHANRTETLTALLLQHLAVSDAGVYAAEQVIVPSTAMRRTLSLAVADTLGICANIRFSFLAQWLWRTIGAVVPGTGEESPFAQPQLGWRVYRAFGDADLRAAHPRLAGYLDHADARMRHELAGSAAAQLERYVGWRAGWLRQWSQGRTGEPEHPDTTWQAALWRRIESELGLRDPQQAFAEALQRGHRTRHAALPARLHVFALPDLPPQHLQLLRLIAQSVEVHVYLRNPCREYWFELVDPRRLRHLALRGRAAGHEVGHKLLAAWGRQARAQIEAWVDAAGDGDVDDAHFTASGGTSLLARLQDSLLDLHDIEPGAWPLAEGDRSIELHVCHSTMRELEVLQDRLLGLIAATPGLRCADIAVVMPDIDSAAPLIDALFGSAPRDRHMPYTISGLSRRGADPCTRALLALLSLAGSRCTAIDLFALLQMPAVARRFGLDDEALAAIHRWLRDAGFRWALDSRHIADCSLPPQPRHTLDDALQRLFLGHVLPTLHNEPFRGLLGAGDAEGSDAQALGSFWRFAQRLQRLHAQVASPLLPEQWAGALNAALDGFVQPADDEIDDLRELRRAIDTLCSGMQRGGIDEPLPLEVLRAALEQQLDDAGQGGVAGGGISFAPIGSLRGLAFEVVCAIGLNDGAFPSSPRAAEFDLIAAHPQRGDRSRRDEDRAAMLDLLLAARHSLYLSCTGRSMVDNSLLPPSVLVAELLDLLVPAIAEPGASARSLEQAKARLVVEHPLQPFAREGFAEGGDPRLRSHNRELAEALRHAPAMQSRADTAGEVEAGGSMGSDIGVDNGEPAADTAAANGEADTPAETFGESLDARIDEVPDDVRTDTAADTPRFFATALPPPEAEWREVSLAQLVEFFRNPCRCLLRRRMLIEMPYDEPELSDHEDFVADRRERASLANRLIPALLQGATPEAIAELARCGTELPEGSVGRIELQHELPLLQAFAAHLDDAAATPCLPPQTIEIDLDFGGERWTLRAAFADLRAQGLLRWRYGNTRAGDYLEAWLNHLVLCARTPAGVQPLTRWLSADGGFTLQPVDDAAGLLRGLLQLYRRGLCEPLHFFPRSAWQQVRHGRSRALAAWTTRPGQPPGEGDDAAYQLALRGIAEPLDADFAALAEAVYAPLCAHLEDPRL